MSKLMCKLHDREHPYKVCRDCGHQYCDRYWNDCPRCNPRQQPNIVERKADGKETKTSA